MTLEKARELISDMSQENIKDMIVELEETLLLAHKCIEDGLLETAILTDDATKYIRMAAHEQGKLDKSLYA